MPRTPAGGVGRRLYSKTNECPEGELYWIRGQNLGRLADLYHDL